MEQILSSGWGLFTIIIIGFTLSVIALSVSFNDISDCGAGVGNISMMIVGVMGMFYSIWAIDYGLNRNDSVEMTPIVEAGEVDQTPLEPAEEIDKTLTYEVSYMFDKDKGVWKKYYEVTIYIENFNIFDQNKVIVYSEGHFESNHPVNNIIKGTSSFLITVDVDSYDEIEIIYYKGYLVDEMVQSKLFINEAE